MKTQRQSLWGILLFTLVTLASHTYATTFGSNLVTNGDAETGTLGGWTATINAGAVTNTDAYLGENVQTLHGKVFAICDGGTNVEAMFAQTINISDVQASVATGLVSFAFSVEAFSWYGATVVYTVEELGASNNLLNAHTSGTISLSPQNVNYIFYGGGNVDSSACTWTSTHFQAAGLDASTTQLRITVYGKTSNIASDYVDFDNFELILTSAPTVTTTAVTTYGKNTATLGGNVTASNGASVTARGVVYSTSDATPTIGEAGVTQDANGSGLGVFSESIASLSAGTLYYARAYATNSAGTSYGSVVSFTTAAPFIVKVEGPAAGDYKRNAELNFILEFSEAVTVSGDPVLDLLVGAIFARPTMRAVQGRIG